MKNIHFIGICGTGMSALAQYYRLAGCQISGSDRLHNNPNAEPIIRKLSGLGITISEQNGNGITKETDTVIMSTAIEDNNPDKKKALALTLPILHRSELLAKILSQHKTIAVSGTSGKSTVTAMIYEILYHSNMDPSLITGAQLLLLNDKDLLGNAVKGNGNWLVIEADESDGTLKNYYPELGVILNIDRDHKEIGELEAIFATFSKHAHTMVINGDDKRLKTLFPDFPTFGTGRGSTFMVEDIKLSDTMCFFKLASTHFSIPFPGRHNVDNALAAIAAARTIGIDWNSISTALKTFKGVARRFQLMGSVNGVQVIDDFAHNPVKIKAALETTFLRSQKTLAVFQPHGYSSTRFQKDELIAMFSNTLRDKDSLFMPEIYYAGGTVEKDISSRQIVDAVSKSGKRAEYFENKEAIIPRLTAQADEHSVILVMGARDPGLPAFCDNIIQELQAASVR